MKRITRIGCLAGGLAMLCLTAVNGRADDSSDVRQQLLLLQQQNAAMQQQLQQQQQLIQSLDQRLSEVQAASQKQEAEAAPMDHPGFALGKILLSGEAGVAFFRSGPDGQFPNDEFRVDEARLFVDAQLMNDVYFFGELDLVTRDDPNNYFTLGELYLDVEDISRLWGQDGVLNLRAGRLDIPFGEEYLTRYAIDNPLIMHSLSDLWGYNEGVELYGKAGEFQYVLAVQNGGISSLHDYDSDKAVVARVGADPTRWLHLSVSGMRTGALNTEYDQASALWFGNGFFQSIGNPAATKVFQADLVEGDVQLRLPRGYVKAAGGYAYYNDSSTAADDRNIFYYYTEGLFDITKRFYAVTRFSQILAPNGYPIVGNGNFGEYYNSLTRELWRLSLGVGFRWSPNLIWKTEYMFEQGTEIGGGLRRGEDMLATELTGKF
jgi:hypothetical protein